MRNSHNNDQRKESMSSAAGAASPNPWLAYAASAARDGLGPDHWPIAVTFFRDKFAKTKWCEDLAKNI
jgi:hypothetical protein